MAKNLDRLLQQWKNDVTIYKNIVHWETIPERKPKLTPFPSGLHRSLYDGLLIAGIQSLYKHQLNAFNLVKSGKHLIITTGTASGKSLCYNLPVLDSLLSNSSATALYLFPTKALAHDQKVALVKLLSSESDISKYVSTYDGDTEYRQRSVIRKRARIILTNPDMLHSSILPHHPQWADFFTNMRFVVIDEMHTYRGVFGSHVTNVIRRLKRITRYYETKLTFILTSATIGNPVDLAQKLIDEEVTLINEDTSARGCKHYVIYNPPVVDPQYGLRVSTLEESIRLAKDLYAYNIQSILFGRSRRTIELAIKYLKSFSPSKFDMGRNNQYQIQSYRSGYLPKERREIERNIRDGLTRLVISTNALELGIDIGKLYASLQIGFPGTIASMWQQAGRAGRGLETSLSILVTSSGPLDQFLANNPDFLFEKSPEFGLINPDNLILLLEHLKCSAYEIPFAFDELYGNLDHKLFIELLDYLAEYEYLHFTDNKYYWIGEDTPASNVQLRNISGRPINLYTIVDHKKIIMGYVDYASAPWMVHPEAIYIHSGQTFLVKKLDLETYEALLKPVDPDYYTVPKTESSIDLILINDEVELGQCFKGYGELQITSQVVGFKKLQWSTQMILGNGEVSLPATKLNTTGYWISIKRETVHLLQSKGLWNNAPIYYGSNWKQQRDAARSRDDYLCKNCGILEINTSHDVHHKKPFREFTSYREANQLDNLITLCQSCHNKFESVVLIKSGLSGFSYILRHIAPLFLMCDMRDLGVHFDHSSLFPNGDTVIIIYELIPSGIGFSSHLFEIHSDLIRYALDLVSSCDCNYGCPSCVGPGGEHGRGGKKETLALIRLLIDD